MPDIQYFFLSLIGNWILDRTIYNDDIKIMSGSGVAKINYESQNQLLYTEKLTAQYLESGKSIQAIQRYKYSIDNEQNIITKFLKNGALFYNLQVYNKNYAIGQHQCANDIYQAEYKLTGDSINLTYLVTGPQKNYFILNRYFKKQNALTSNS
jgi:hypothetical protein